MKDFKKTKQTFDQAQEENYFHPNTKKWITAYKDISSIFKEIFEEDNRWGSKK